MHELMKISDLLIGKPGGLTTAEALACGLPMAIIQPIPGQEERNSDHLLEEGAAIRCNELTTLPFKIDRLLDHPTRLAAMRRAATAMGRPHAARTVVQTLLDDDQPPLVARARSRPRGHRPGRRPRMPVIRNDFLWGVSTSAYQVEGGFNGPNEPKTNWAKAGGSRPGGSHTGAAADFWNRYEEKFLPLPGARLDGFPSRPGVEPDPAHRVDGLFRRLLRPSIPRRSITMPPSWNPACGTAWSRWKFTLHHFVHPAWLGHRPMARPTATPEHFARFTSATAVELSRRAALPRPLQWFITINEPNMLVLNSYLGRQFPHAGEGGGFRRR